MPVALENAVISGSHREPALEVRDAFHDRTERTRPAKGVGAPPKISGERGSVTLELRRSQTKNHEPKL